MNKKKGGGEGECQETIVLRDIVLQENLSLGHLDFSAQDNYAYAYKSMHNMVSSAGFPVIRKQLDTGTWPGL